MDNIGEDIVVVFFSNYLNHHQIPLCEALYRKTQKEFRFVATSEMSDERKKLGYKSYDEEPYLLDVNKSAENHELALKLGYEADIVIIGSAPDIYIEKRLADNKMTFRYSERFFRNGKWRIIDPRVFLSLYKHGIRYRNLNLYMLCASSYTAADCRFAYSYPQKTFKWGYFPAVRRYGDFNNMVLQKEPFSILWVGRFIKLKHPESTIRLARYLKKRQMNFSITMIGSGPLVPEIEKQIQKYDLGGCIKIIGAMSTEDVRTYMESARIFLFTSDKCEGWGAVVNEAMNSGCIVIANRKIGSVPYLIRNGINGFWYNGTQRDLNNKVEKQLSNPSVFDKIPFNAYNTIIQEWNAEIAADRLLVLAESLRKNKLSPFSNGPCSPDF